MRCSHGVSQGAEKGQKPSCPDTVGAEKSSPPAYLINLPSSLFLKACRCLSKVNLSCFWVCFNCIFLGLHKNSSSRKIAFLIAKLFSSTTWKVSPWTFYYFLLPLNSSWIVLWFRLWFCSPGSSCWSGTRLFISLVSWSASWGWAAWLEPTCLWEDTKEQVSLCVYQVTCFCAWGQGKTMNIHSSIGKRNLVFLVFVSYSHLSFHI